MWCARKATTTVHDTPRPASSGARRAARTLHVKGCTWRNGVRGFIECYRQDLIHFGEIYMRRWILRARGLGEIRLHHTRGPDGVRESLHTHPWRKWWSWLIKGRYVQHIQRHPPQGPVEIQRRKWLSIARMDGEVAHAITEVSPGGAWTVVVCTFSQRKAERGLRGKGDHRWGFWDGDTLTPSNVYFQQHPQGEMFGSEHQWYLGAPRC